MIFEVKVPSPGESVTEVAIETWYKEDGAYVKRDEQIADIQSDKVTLALYAEEAGQLKILVPEGETIEVGTVVCTIDTEAKPSAGAQDGGGNQEAKASQESRPAPAQSTEKPAAQAESTSRSEHYASGEPSPAAAKLMAERGVSASDIQGSGRDQRITKADVVKHQPEPAEEKQPAPESGESSAAPQPTGERGVRREKMKQLRRTLAARLVSAKNDTAMLTTFNEVDLTYIKDIRRKYKERFQEIHEVSLGFMSFFTKACCVALKEFPRVNAFIDGNEIEYHDYVDMGIAVSTDRGLVVPIVRDADQRSLADIEKQIISLATRARDGKLTIPEMTGGTFTITNGGVFGSLMSTPILNPPQSAILGMHKIQDRPMAMGGEVKIRPMMYLALSYDHRIIDGKESVSFLVRVKELLEDPIRLLLNV